MEPMELQLDPPLHRQAHSQTREVHLKMRASGHTTYTIANRFLYGQFGLGHIRQRVGVRVWVRIIGLVLLIDIQCCAQMLASY